MIELIKGLEIEGRKFASKTVLDFFEVPRAGAIPQRLLLIYGRNGTGKTTIASAFRQAYVNSIDPRLAVSIIMNDDSRIPLPDESKMPSATIRVFDEKYIDEKIKLRPDKTGLGTIVLFSDSGDLEQELAKHENELDETNKIKEKLAAEISELEDSSKPSSPLHQWEDIKKQLKVGWAEEDRILRGAERKSSVSDNLVTEIGTLVCSTAQKDIESEREKIQRSLAALENAGDLNGIPKLSKFEVGNFDEDGLIGLLNQKVEKPELSDREKSILSVIYKYGDRIDEIRTTFSDATTSYCPYCFRDIDAKGKESIIASIEKVLNREVDDYKARLSSVTFPSFDFNKTIYAPVDCVLSDKIEAQLKKVSVIVESYRNDVKMKSGNVFQDSIYDTRNLSSAIGLVNELVVELERKRTSLVEVARQKDELGNRLFRLCKEKAHYQMSASYKTYLRQVKVLEEKRKKHAEVETSVATLEKRIDDLKAQKRGTKLAVHHINKALRYIYASDKRLTVEPKDDEYIIKSYGVNIKPSDVSTGERHALALAYFFVDIMENHRQDEFYKDESLVVIDDPVSSFDAENKIGVLSYLVRQFCNVLRGNENSRIIVLTHDAYTMVQLANACDSITKDMLAQNNARRRFLSLTPKGGLSEFDKGKHNEYSSLLQDVYSYAKTGKNATCAFAVGNEIRRVLEAYSTFLYRKNFLALFYDAVAKEKLGDLFEYFASRMDRIVLNGESHMMCQTQTLSSECNYFSEISDTEKQQVAKDVLCLLYALEPDHLQAHLTAVLQENAGKGAIVDIELWTKEIRSRQNGTNEGELSSKSLVIAG